MKQLFDEIEYLPEAVRTALLRAFCDGTAPISSPGVAKTAFIGQGEWDQGTLAFCPKRKEEKDDPIP